jgi:hypothetical protein
MTSEAKAEANRRNAQMSTGPTSPEGKANSSQNRRTHGLSAASILPETLHPEFAARLAEWADDYEVVTAEGRFALETAVAMTFRMSRCLAAEHDATVDEMDRARLAWDDDRLAEVATLLASLPRRPEVVAYRLRGSAHGLTVMIRLWRRLGETLDAKQGAWSESETAMACDLLGLATHLRGGRLPFDPPDGADVHASRRDFITREVAALTSALEERLGPLDSLKRERARSGSTAFLNKSTQLILRYERDAWRRYSEAVKVVHAEAAAAWQAQHEAARRAAQAPTPARSARPAPQPAIDPAPAPAVAGPGRAPALSAREVRIVTDPAPPPTPAPPTSAAAPAPSPRPMNRRQRRRERALARA